MIDKYNNLMFPSASFWNVFDPFNETSRAPLASTKGSISGLSMYEEGEHLVVQASLPGLKLDEIDITLERGILSIKGESKHEENDEKKTYYHKSSRVYTYNVELPGKTDSSKEPVASYENGILKIVFDKSETNERQKIIIQTV